MSYAASNDQPVVNKAKPLASFQSSDVSAVLKSSDDTSPVSASTASLSSVAETAPSTQSSLKATSEVLEGTETPASSDGTQSSSSEGGKKPTFVEPEPETEPEKQEPADKPEAKETKTIPCDCIYRVGRELGTGTYSVVKEARHIETNKWYAAKVINKKLMRGREHLVRNEVVVLKRVSRGHSNILTLVDYFETDNSLYLITELAKGGELFDRIYSRGSFYESDAAKIIKEITSGVAHLHAHGIVHRDLKPENILFKTQSDRSNLLICDFGLSRIIDEENFRMLTTTVGTPSYMAPEIFTEKGHGKPVDIWAIGVITYFLLCGYTPFDRDTAAEEREAIIVGEVKFEPQEYWIHVTSDALRFIRACLQIDPEHRPSAAQCLEMPFLTRRYRKEADLLPHVMSNMNLKTNPSEFGIPSTLEGRAMNGAYSRSPDPEKPAPSIFSAKWG